MRIEPLRNFLFDAIECTAADKENVLRIYVYIVLVGVLASSLWRHVYNRAFKEFEQSLLYALARYVASDGRVVALAGNLVNLVDKHDAALCFLHVEIRHLQQAREYALHVFAHVAGFGEHRSVDNRKRHVEEFGNGAGEQCLARARRAYHNNIGFLNLYLVGTGLLLAGQTLVMVVDGNCQRTFRIVLADNVLVEIGFNLGRFGHGTLLGSDLCLFGFRALAFRVCRSYIIGCVIVNQSIFR